MLRGLDASQVQSLLPYDRLGSQYKFVILKAQEGNDGFDDHFERNMKAGFNAGLEVFPYCFTFPLPHLDPVEQAKLFVDKVYRFKEMAGRPIFVDAEWPPVVPTKPKEKGWKEWGCSPAQISDWQRRNAEAVHAQSGVLPRIYTYPWWWGCLRDGAPAYGFLNGADVSWAEAYPLWMADYTNRWPVPGEKPKLPKPWKTWEFWQFDGNGGLKLPNGVDSDFCVFNGDEADLARVAGKTPVPGFDLTTVAGVQARLTELGYTPGAIDGVVGPRTRLAVKAFQVDHGLVADGVIGPKTRAALA